MTLITRLVHGLRRHRRRRIAPALTAAVALAGALAGCGGDDDNNGTGPANVAGTYHVVSTNGPAGPDNSAPFLLFSTSVAGVEYRAELASGSITLATNNRYTGTGTLNLYVGGTLYDSDDSFGGIGGSGGTYSVSGNTVTFQPDDPSEDDFTATFSGGNTLTAVVATDDTGVGTMTFTIVARK